VKARGELEDADVRAKAIAAAKWCRTATEHAPANPGKPWAYLLIPDDQIAGNATLEGLASRFAVA
jgi:type III restriction enzyme